MTSKQRKRVKRKAVKDTVYRWQFAEIPYSFADNHFNKEATFMIKESMSEWERYTCLSFKTATPSHKNTLHLINGNSCSSQLGMVGNRQLLHLQAPGCRFRGLYLHEIGHAIGLIHEHQRPDRDDFIQIIPQNVRPELLSQFTKYQASKVDLVNTNYEYSSIMHYGITAFSYNGQAQTIRTKDPSREEEIGRVYLKELSFNDVKAVNNMYNCSSVCSKTVKCLQGGYVDQTCRCICPDGSRNCEVGYDETGRNDECKNDMDDWQCNIWANSGQCSRNRKFMAESCQKACHVCGSPTTTNDCKDVYPEKKCASWKARGDCISNEWWMALNCERTCNACVGKDKRPETSCKNKNKDSKKCDNWALSGECDINPVWMHINCQKACQLCDKTPPTVDTTDGNVECVDIHDKTACMDWSSAGECENNPIWMMDNCKQSCGECGESTIPPTECVDSYDTTACMDWSSAGECTNNPTWMLNNCKRSCGQCEGITQPTTIAGCNDIHPDKAACLDWAEYGQCETNSWMIDNCKQSCGACEASTKSTTTTPIPTQEACANTHVSERDCNIWAEHDHCIINPTWMHEYCQKSCGLCITTTPAPTTTIPECACGQKTSGVTSLHPPTTFMACLFYLVICMLYSLL